MKSQTQHIGNYSNVFDYSPFGAPLDGRTMENIFYQEEITTDTIEFYIINACNSSHFEVDNVFIAHEEDLVVESKNYVVSNSYRYGFNGMEKDDNIKGEGNSYTTEFRQYDPRVGRWLSVDPLASKYPDLSPYNFVANSPIIFIDPDGEKIIDSEGNEIEVTLAYNKETDSWSADYKFVVGTSNKTKREFRQNGMRIINAMIQVDNGRELIEKAIESKYKIHYNLTDNDFIRSEKTELPNGMYTETLKGELGNVNVIYATIYNLETGEITKGEIEKIEVSIHKGSIRTMKEKDNKNLTVRERIAIVGSHETYHAVEDAEYIREYGYFDENNEQHKGAYETEEKTERQILKKKE